jgi:hypothetical protein
MPPLRTSKLQEKPLALKREHPALQKMKSINFFQFFLSFLPFWIRFRSGFGSTLLVEASYLIMYVYKYIYTFRHARIIFPIMADALRLPTLTNIASRNQQVQRVSTLPSWRTNRSTYELITFIFPRQFTAVAQAIWAIDSKHPVRFG